METPSIQILKIKNSLRDKDVKDLLWDYGTTDLSIIAIMIYLDKQAERK